MPPVVARRLVVLLPLSLAACAQFTTSDAELANLKQMADARADTYINCVKAEAASIGSNTDYEFVKQAVAARCEESLDAYSEAQEEYLGAQYMVTGKPLAASVQELEDRGQTEVAEILVARDAGEPVAAKTETAPDSQLALPSSMTAASAAGVAAVTAWNPEQRVYLDCMDEQADAYMRLNESAESIAAVAANKCSSYLTVERRAALEQEGKVRVMTKIMDQRVSGAR